MIKILTATVVTIAMASSSSACWFPFFPTYSAGYAGWGFPAPAYSYASYGRPYGYQNSYGYAPVSYGVPYAASYGGFSTSMGCNTCGLSSCCGTCGNISTVGYANYGSGCGTNCASVNCIPSDVVNKPIPSNVGDEGEEEKTFVAPAESRPPYNPSTDRAPIDDDFSSKNNDLDEPAWLKNRRSEDGTRPPMFDDSNSYKPPMEDPEDPDATIDQTGYKPPISDPMKQEDGDATDGETADPDLLAPEAPAESARRSSIFYASNTRFRSSHSDVLRPQRTAKKTTGRRSAFTQISTSKSSQTAPRWISLPMPVGRERI